jgi:hypothetical protein
MLACACIAVGVAMKGLLHIAGYAIACVVLAFSIVGLIPLILLAVFTFRGAEKRAEKALGQVPSTLMKGETVIAQGIQHRALALSTRRVVLAITSSRIIIIRRGLLGGFTMKDVQWKDLADATLEQNVLSSVCGSNLRFKNLSGAVPLIEVDGMDTATASTIYKTAQFQEQAWEEKRRMRSIEEVRAAAGGVTVHAAPQSAAPSRVAPPSENQMLEQIRKAKELLDIGAVSDVEFQEMKSRIIGGGRY